jgi:hypothetical protein
MAEHPGPYRGRRNDYRALSEYWAKRSRYYEAENVREAVKRLNVDWDEVARSCGDPKCNGDCRWVRVLRENGVI